MPKPKRVRLTAKQAASPEGRQLLNLILSTIHDGEIELSEIVKLHAFLIHAPASMNAVSFLRCKTRAIIFDDRIDPAEAYDLKCAFVRVVTKEVCGIIETHLEDIGAPARKKREPAWKRHPATERQIAYIIDLGGTPTAEMTKGQASELIEQLLERRPTTPRQIMVLRFFDRLDLVNAGKDVVSWWSDEAFAGVSPAERAWEKFKRDSGHDLNSLDPDVVPIGEYRKYMS